MTMLMNCQEPLCRRWRVCLRVVSDSETTQGGTARGTERRIAIQDASLFRSELR